MGDLVRNLFMGREWGVFSERRRSNCTCYTYHRVLWDVIIWASKTWFGPVDGGGWGCVVGTIGQGERPPWGQLWMEQCLTSLKYWPI